MVRLQQARVGHWQGELAAHAVAAEQGVPYPDDHGFDVRISIPTLMGVDANYLVLAADHVLSVSKHMRSLSGSDLELSRAVSLFEKSHPAVKMLRDRMAHVLEYTVGTGGKNPGRQLDPPHVTLLELHPPGEALYGVDGCDVHSHRPADDAASLAEITHRHFERLPSR